jgi:hypothetical protein
MSNDEFLMNDETRNRNDETNPRRTSDFGIRASLDIRHSTLALGNLSSGPPTLPVRLRENA